MSRLQKFLFPDINLKFMVRVGLVAVIAKIPVHEPYVVIPYDWDLEPRTVNPGHVYVVGDNRRVPMLTHDFGQTSIKRIVGAPLW